MPKNKILENIRQYRFELKHLTVLFVVLIIFQFILTYIQKTSLQSFLIETQKWYQQDSAEKMANLTTTSLELLLENIDVKKIDNEKDQQKIIQSFNIIFSQQLLQQNVDDICLIVTKNGKHFVIDEGIYLFDFLRDDLALTKSSIDKHFNAYNYYIELKDEIKSGERIFSRLEGTQTFHLFVPFVPNGEYLGVLYMKKTPDFTNITNEITSSYDEASIIYSSLILLGLLAMYYISSFTVKERNEAQHKLFEENEKHIKEHIIHEKESLFTKRIYHTHHKAEKVMGFIKEDLRQISEQNTKEVIARVTKYSNFISRVIYDMKWYDPPVHTIRNQMFHTNLNEVITFIVKHIFLRISSATDIFNFELDLDDNVPPVNINEFVVWEIFEPLIQNAIDHADVEKIKILIKTEYDAELKRSKISIMDNGKGFDESLLELDTHNIKKLFSENVSTKNTNDQNSGYGCYIAYQMAVKRCGWNLDAYNMPSGGGAFIIDIKY